MVNIKFYGLLVCEVPTFRRNVQPPYSGQKGNFWRGRLVWKIGTSLSYWTALHHSKGEVRDYHFNDDDDKNLSNFHASSTLSFPCVHTFSTPGIAHTTGQKCVCVWGGGGGACAWIRISQIRGWLGTGEYRELCAHEIRLKFAQTHTNTHTLLIMCLFMNKVPCHPLEYTCFLLHKWQCDAIGLSITHCVQTVAQVTRYYGQHVNIEC